MVSSVSEQAIEVVLSMNRTFYMDERSFKHCRRLKCSRSHDASGSDFHPTSSFYHLVKD